MAEREPFSWPKDWEMALSQARASAYTCCRSYGIDAHDTEDVLQNVSLRLWKATNSSTVHFLSLRKVGAWATKVANRIMIDEYNKRSRHVRKLSFDLAAIPESQEGDVNRRALEEYFKIIPDARQREALRLRLDNYTYDEIAANLQVSTSNAHAMISAAFEILRERFNREWP